MKILPKSILAMSLLLMMAIVSPQARAESARITGSQKNQVVVAPTGTKWALSMLAIVNAQRAQAGLGRLALCPPLMRASAKYATSMASTGHFDHTGLDGSQPGNRGLVEGYHYRTYAENIAAGQDTVEAVMDSWEHSPGHLANLMGRQYTHVGFGHAERANSAYKDYWVQNFGAGGKC